MRSPIDTRDLNDSVLCHAPKGRGTFPSPSTHKPFQSFQNQFKVLLHAGSTKLLFPTPIHVFSQRLASESSDLKKAHSIGPVLVMAPSFMFTAKLWSEAFCFLVGEQRLREAKVSHPGSSWFQSQGSEPLCSMWLSSPANVLYCFGVKAIMVQTKLARLCGNVKYYELHIPSCSGNLNSGYTDNVYK